MIATHLRSLRVYISKNTFIIFIWQNVLKHIVCFIDASQLGAHSNRITFFKMIYVIPRI